MTLEHDQIREKLIVTALELMDEGGVEKVKAREVAQRVGVSVGTVYNLFGNVAGLLQHANSRIYSALNDLGMAEIQRIEAALAAGIASGEIADTAKDKLRYRLLRLSEVYIEFVAANEKRWGALLAFNRSRAASEAEDWYFEQQEALIGILARVLEGSPLAADDAKRAVAARALWSAVHGIVTMNLVGQTRGDPKAWTWAQIEVLVSAFSEGIFVETAAPG